MGLTASPVQQPCKDHKQLTRELTELCANLDSNFAEYPFGEQITNKTEIEIIDVKSTGDKEHHHLLL